MSPWKEEIAQLPPEEIGKLDDIQTEKALKFLNGMIEAVSRPHQIG